MAYGVTESTGKRDIIILAGIIIFCLCLLLVNIKQPWIGMDGLHGVKRSIEAKNLLRYGFLDINLGLSNNYEVVEDIKDLHYYQHHPPLNSILIGIVFSIFGVSEISARILPIFFTILSIVLIYKIANYVRGRHVALMSAFIFSIMPATTYWGNTPSYQPLTLFFILLTLFLYINWMKNRSTGKFILMIFVYFISLMCDWPSYFLGLLLPIHMIITEKKIFPLRKEAVLIPLVTVCSFSLFLYYVYIVQPEEITSLFTQLKIYLSMVDKPVGTIDTTHGGEFLDFTMKQFFAKNLRFATLLFTYPALILSLFGIYITVKDIKHERETGRTLIPLVLLFLAFLYNAIFYRSVFIHNWWLFYFGAPIAILSGIAIDGIIRKNMAGEKPFWDFPVSSGYVFMLVLLLIPAFLNFKDFHGMQRKILPGDRHESVTLTENVSGQLRSNTSGSDVIITNLPTRGTLRGPQVAFYSERKIIGNIDSVKELQKTMNHEGDHQYIFFLFDDNPLNDPEVEALRKELSENYSFRTLKVEGYKFKLFSLLSLQP